MLNGGLLAEFYPTFLGVAFHILGNIPLMQSANCSILNISWFPHFVGPYQGLLWCYMYSSVAMITLLTTSIS